MFRYIIKRTLLALGIIFSISLITFLILNVLPGDPVAAMLGDFADANKIKEVRHNLGLDVPLWQQYFQWISNLLKGDFGNSYFQKKSVLFLILQAFQYTSFLAVLAYVIALIVGLSMGIIAAVNHGSLIDRSLMTLSVLGISAPSFWVAILLQIYIGLNFKIFPVSGVQTPIGYVLPAIALGTRYAASIARVTRASMMEVMGQDFIRTAYAKGLGSFRIVMVHILRNALIPIITIIGADIGSLLTGSMITENVFNIPGIGKLLIDAIGKRDIPLVQGGVIYVATVCVIVYFVVDILYAVVNPNIRLGASVE
ncbi:ABC transporter permease [Oribacterium sp. WCC10]|uniref:ABC transporter permease n=1 Tax=Oribacterium sp. WCC10 TaxID=1855343 RepID=UPI0008E8478C|nr:ABC transporter permease [Oribacterium sp. WCC10]SFG76579.1 peptide/nickel transport system permease protein [Oribacterium sp. WCC10]